MFSKSCEYALQSTLYITLHSTDYKKVGLKEIAAEQKIPSHFLSKILQQLVKHKILQSIKGPNGGFGLHRNASKIKLLEVVNAIDGLDIFERCGIGMKSCSDNHPCPIHDDFKLVKGKIRKMLTEKSLADMAVDIGKGKSFVTYRK